MTMNEIAEQVRTEFKNRFSGEPNLYFSPGRINLIGEHIDYNDGFVMPAAVDKGVYYAVELNNSDTINLFSIDFDEAFSIKITEIKKTDSWKNYVLGVVNEFLLAGKKVEGFDCVFGGNIANGAGMSSSAAVEGGIAFALNELLNFGLNRKELALLCQRAEHDFPGVKCGIMDQYANMCGKNEQVILLDCRSITHEYLPLHLGEYSIVLVNSKVHHSLAASEYNQRRKQCDEGLEILKHYSTVQSFRDVTKPEDLLGFEGKMGEEVYLRCLYVVEEIYRTKKAAQFLKNNDIASFGKLMFKTHEGLRNLYHVSCKELDFLVGQAAQCTDVAGARLMGGGFGGCTINLIKQAAKEKFIADILSAYKNEFNIDAEIYEVSVVDGVNKL